MIDADKIAAAVERLSGPGAEFEAMAVADELAAVFVAAAHYCQQRNARNIETLESALSRCAEAVMR